MLLLVQGSDFCVMLIFPFVLDLRYPTSGPAWQSVAKVHRDAYGVAGTLVAAAIFLSGEEGSLDQVSTRVQHGT